ncbi:hypothetical protein A3SI_07329 [Nitritalea halalkaliphila LW7]|uniref:Uncharacterized protein n=1 Tax=Nitritalea halalkaliphila LW7 TaxID=1189621 RepID=I5C5J8_9BACT|nr:CBS domain-containing protein [Nitritalea halalkaliphila]EIM77100.1 hypothetical protein A3SI_07329 [Nitritalea halalkaliphila LW7]
MDKAPATSGQRPKRLRPFDRLRLIFEEQLSVLTLAEPLLIFSLADYKEKMAQQGFHSAFMQDEAGIFWCFEAGDTAPRLVESTDWLAPETPLLSVFRLLQEKRRYFIRDEEGLPAYIVTRTDLDKMPMRLGIFGMISIFETYLKEKIRQEIADWQGSISAERLAAAQQLYAIKRAREEEIDLVQCLQFGDIGSIYSKQQRFRAFDQNLSRDRWVQQMNAIGKLRDALAHSQAHLGLSWPEIGTLIAFIRSVVDE